MLSAAHVLLLTCLMFCRSQNVGAVIAFILDMREHKSTLALLQQPEMGFLEHDDGAWTWTCVQQELRQPVEAPSGSALNLATVFGLPFVRLRAALPEVMFAGSVGSALGRRAGLSVTGLAENAEFDITAMKQLAQALSCFAPSASNSKIPEFDAELGASSAPARQERSGRRTKSPRIPLPQPGASAAASPAASRSSIPPAKQLPKWTRPDTYRQAAAPPPEAKADTRSTELVGTALVFAFMSNTKTVPVAELAKRTAAASAHLAGVRVPGIDRGFDELLGLFKVMLTPGNLSSRGDWLEKSRLWRLILLQRADGGFDINE